MDGVLDFDLFEEPKPLNSGTSLVVDVGRIDEVVSIFVDTDSGGVIGGGEAMLLTLEIDREAVGVAMLPF